MRTLLFTGPGGAGTTTVAAAAAVRAARTGRRVLLLSVQEAPAGTDGPEVVRVDPRAGLEGLWGEWAGQLSAAVPGLALPPATSVVPLPGAGELALLAALGGPAAQEADLVVVDAGPLEAAVGLVALPGALRWWLEQALPTRLRMLGAVRTAAVRAGTVRRGAVDVALDAVPALEDLLGRLPLADPAATAVRLVAVPRPGAAAALRRAAASSSARGPSSRPSAGRGSSAGPGPRATARSASPTATGASPEARAAAASRSRRRTSQASQSSSATVSR